MTLLDAVIGAEALIGRQLTPQEMKLVRIVAEKRQPVDEMWNSIAGVLGVKTSQVVRLLLTLKMQAGGPDYERTAKVLRDDAEWRIKEAGWAS